MLSILVDVIIDVISCVTLRTQYIIESSGVTLASVR